MHGGRRLQHWVANIGHRPGFDDALAAFPHDFRKPLRLVKSGAVPRGLNLNEWPSEAKERFVVGGRWRTKRRAIVRDTVHQIFAEGRHYTESDQYRRMVSVLESGSGAWNYRCESLDDIHAYFERLIATHEHMRTNGYLTQPELGGEAHDEVKVYIPSDGRLLIGNGGNHRLAMAHLLGINRVPAIIAGVHTHWARQCFDRFGPPLTDAVYLGLDELPTVRRESHRERARRRARARELQQQSVQQG